MKKNIRIIILIACLCIPILACSLFLLFFRTKETHEVWLQRYDEKAIEVKKGNVDDYTWKSSDDSVVIVEDGKLIAQKTSKEAVTVTGRSLRHTVSIVVKRVNDSAGKPKIVLEDSRAYVGIKKELTPKIVYNNTEMDVSKHQLKYTSTIADPEFATSDGLSVTGVQVGESVVLLQTEYKGLKISGSAKLTVKPATYVEVLEDTIEIHNADNDKVNQSEIKLEVCIDGQEIEKPEISYRVIEGDNACVTFENNKVIANKEGKVTVEASLKEHESAIDTFVVNVNPPYDPETFFISDRTRGVTYEPYNGTVGGRSKGLTRYISGKHDITPEGWGDIWPHRIVNSKVGNTTLIEAYRSGYRYFTYDIYFKDQSIFLVGYTNGGTTYQISYDTFFYLPWVKILNENGEVVNRVVKDQWLTVVYDLYAMILEYPSATLSYFYTAHNEGKEIFFSNICYRYDSSFMKDDGVSYERKEGYIQASNCDFHSYASADNSIYKKHNKSVGGVEGAYRLTGRSDDYLQNTMVAVSTLGASRGDSLVRMAERGKYLTYDLYIEKADAIYFSILSKEVEFAATVGVTDFSKCDWISIVANGKLQYTLEKGRWQTIIIDYEKLAMNSNLNTSRPVAFEFAVMNKTNVVYVNNVRYYPDNKFMPTQYAGKAPSGFAAKNKNKAKLEEVKSGTFKGTTLYTNVTGDGEVYFQEVQNGTKAGTFMYMGKKYISFAFYLNSNVSSFSMDSAITRAGYTIENHNTVTVGKQLASDGNLRVYDKNGKAVKQVKAGQWYILEYYVEYMDRPESVDVTFRAGGKNAKVYVRDLELTKTPKYERKVANSAFIPGWIGVSSPEASVVQVQEGEFAGSERYINWTQSEYSGASFAAIKDGSFYKAGYKYLCYDFYLTEDVSTLTFYAWATSPKEKDTKADQTMEVGGSFTQHKRFYFFNAEGKTVNRLKAGQWYTVAYEMVYPESPDWSFVFIRTNGVNGSTCYLKNFKGSNKLPYKYEEFKPIKANPLGFEAGTAKTTITKVTKDGEEVIKAEGNKVLFTEVMDIQSKKGDFFPSGYKYVTFDLFVESVETNFLFNTSNVNIFTNGAGYDWSVNHGQTDYLRAYQDGVRTPIDKGQWYTVSMKVESYSSDVSIAVQGGVATIYLKNLSFGNAFPKETPFEAKPLGFIAGSKDPNHSKVENAIWDGEEVIKATARKVCFQDVIDDVNNKAKGKFFTSGYTYLQFDVYIEDVKGSYLQVATSGKNMICNGKGEALYSHETNKVGDWVRVYNQDGVQSTLKAGAWYTISVKVEATSNDVSFVSAGTPSVFYLKNLRFTHGFPDELITSGQLAGFTAGNGTTIYRASKDGEEVVKASGTTIYFQDVMTASGEKGKFFTQGYKYVQFDMYIESVDAAFLFNTSNLNIWTNGAGFDWSTTGKQGDYLRSYKDGTLTPLNKGAWYTVSMRVDSNSSEVSIVSQSGEATVYLKNLLFANDFPKEVVYTKQALGFIAGDKTIFSLVTMDGEEVVKMEDGKWVYFENVMSPSGEKGSFFGSGYKYVKFDMYIESVEQSFLFNTSTTNIWTNGAGYDWSVNPGQGDYLRTYQNGVRKPINKGSWYTVYMKVESYSSDVSVVSQGGVATIYLKNLSFATKFPE